MNNASSYLRENEEHNIPSHILRPFLDCMPQLYLDPSIFGFQYICVVLWSQTPPKLPTSSGQLVELIVYIIQQE